MTVEEGGAVPIKGSLRACWDGIPALGCRLHQAPSRTGGLLQGYAPCGGKDSNSNVLRQLADNRSKVTTIEERHVLIHALHARSLLLKGREQQRAMHAVPSKEHQRSCYLFLRQAL